MSPDGSTVTFRRVVLESRRPVERFARRLEAEVTRGRPFDCLITTDAELRRLNREFRGEDHATDVLSFPAIPQSGADLQVRAGPPGPALRSTDTPPKGRPGGRPRTRGSAPHLSHHSLHLGDLAISLPRARSQARAFGHDTGKELQILMLHGVLHLLGMDHETDRGRMARAEKRWRARLGLPNGLIERVQS